MCPYCALAVLDTLSNPVFSLGDESTICVFDIFVRCIVLNMRLLFDIIPRLKLSSAREDLGPDLMNLWEISIPPAECLPPSYYVSIESEYVDLGEGMVD